MRPQFHFTAQRGWINDPHGITIHDGTYHAFFQYVPESLEWAPNCHWGHATGPDLFSLQEGPVALAPGDGDDGIWTGSLVRADDGSPVIHYTAVSTPDFGIGRVRTARPADATWTRWDKGSVVVTAPDDLDLIAFRDPFVFRDGDIWRMLLGAAGADGIARALSYHSNDLSTWTYDGAAASRSSSLKEPVWMGALWECPQLIEFDDRAAMVTSVWDDDTLYYAGYGLGRYTDGIFEAETWAQLSHGPSYYAPSFFRDAQGRPCLSFWMRGISDKEQGWASAHSVPHLLTLDGDRLIAAPHPDLVSYRRETIDPGRPTRDLAADVTWEPVGASTLTVTSGGDTTLTLIAFPNDLELAVEAERWRMPYSSGPVRVILDGPIVEVSTTDGILGAAIAPAADRLIVEGGGDIRIWALAK